MLMDSVYIQSPVIKMNSRFTNHSLSLLGSMISLVIVITTAILVINAKRTLGITQLTLASTSLSMCTRLSGYINLTSTDLIAVAAYANISIKFLFEKLDKLVKQPAEPEANMGEDKKLLVNNRVVIDKISYRSAEGKANIVQNLSLQIKGNSMVGFYSGYTGDLEALFLLICRVVKPLEDSEGRKGSVFVGNWDISLFSQRGRIVVM